SRDRACVYRRCAGVRAECGYGMGCVLSQWECHRQRYFLWAVDRKGRPEASDARDPMRLAAACLAVSVITGPTSSKPYTIYVASESGDIVTRIEVGPDGWRKLKEIPVGLSPADVAGPHNVAVSPDGRYWYVSIAHGQPFGSIWKFTTGT